MFFEERSRKHTGRNTVFGTFLKKFSGSGEMGQCVYRGVEVDPSLQPGVYLHSAVAEIAPCTEVGRRNNRWLCVSARSQRFTSFNRNSETDTVALLSRCRAPLIGRVPVELCSIASISLDGDRTAQNPKVTSNTTAFYGTGS